MGRWCTPSSLRLASIPKAPTWLWGLIELAEVVCPAWIKIAVEQCVTACDRHLAADRRTIYEAGAVRKDLPTIEIFC